MNLNNCLLKHARALKDFDKSEVIEAAKVYQSRGETEDAANVAAIEDHLRELEAERDRIETDILEQWKKADPKGYAKAEGKETPTKPKKPKADPLADIREFFTPGNIILSDYWKTHDKVLEFKEGDRGSWEVKVVAVKKDGDQWVETEQPRWHATAPGKSKVVDRVGESVAAKEPWQIPKKFFVIDRGHRSGQETVVGLYDTKKDAVDAAEGNDGALIFDAIKGVALRRDGTKMTGRDDLGESLGIAFRTGKPDTAHLLGIDDPGFTPEWMMTIADKREEFKRSDDNFSEYDNDQHRKAVESAIALGKPVPAEVLADYPDLQGKETPASLPSEATKEREYRIGGYPVSGLGDKALQTVIDKSSNEADKAAASDELERRKVGASDTATAGESLAVEPVAEVPAAEADAIEQAEMIIAASRGGIYTGETADSIRAGLHQAIGKATIERLEQRGLLRILNGAADLPNGLTLSETGTAMYDGNTAYLIANRMRPETAIREVLHEIGEHHGLEEMLGKDGYATLTRRVRAMEKFGNQRVLEAFATVRELYPEYADGSVKQMHEVLANIGQDADIQAKPWWQEMIAAVKRWLVKLGYGGLVQAGDIEDMVLHSLKMAARGGLGSVSGGTVDAMEAKVGAGGTAAIARPDFDQFAQKYVDSQPVDTFDHARRIEDAEAEIRDDYMLGNKDGGQFFKQLQKEDPTRFFDEDGDLTDAGNARYQELQDQAVAKEARDQIGEPQQRPVDFSDPTDAAQVLRDYLDMAGLEPNVVGGSGKSRSKYFEIENGKRMIRISDHELPDHYVNDSDIDVLLPNDSDAALAKIKEVAASIMESTPTANKPDLSQGLPRDGMQERAVRADKSGSPEPAQSDGAVGGNANVAQKAFKAVDTESAEFKAWHAGSKVRDTVYHSTPYDFDVFDFSDQLGPHFGTEQAAIERGEKTGGNENSVDVTKDEKSGKWEVWIDNDLEGEYASEKAANKVADAARERKPMAVYLSVKNPLSLPDLGVWSFDGVRSYLNLHNIITDKEATRAWNEWQKSDQAGWTALRSIIEAKGYDSISYHNDVEDAGSVSYIALRPTQIKSAISNTGAFSRDNPSILESRNRGAKGAVNSGIGDATISEVGTPDPAIAGILAEEGAVQVNVTGGNADALSDIAEAFGKRIVWYRESAPDTAGNAVGLQGGRLGLQPGSTQADVGAGTAEGSRGTPGMVREDEGGTAVDIAGQDRVGADGFFDTGRPDLVFLDVAGGNHLGFTLGHELGHAMETDDPALWNQLAGRLEPFVREFATYKRQWHAEKTDANATKEFVSDVIGQNFLDPVFWNRMGREQPTVFQKIGAKFIAVINKALRIMGVDTHPYVSDMVQARAIVASAMVEYGNRVQQGAYAKHARQLDPNYVGKRLMSRQTRQQALPNTGATPSKAEELWSKQIKSGAPASPTKSRIIGDSGRKYTPDQQSMFRQTGREVDQATILGKLMEWASVNWRQGLFDQFQPVRAISDKGYTLLRLSKGATGAFEAFMQHGKLSLKDGAYDADTTGGVMQEVFFPLGKETTDFLYWIAGNRAERLATEGKERLFSVHDIAAAKSLASGTTDFDYVLANGQSTRDRTLIYRDSLTKFNAFNKNVMDMAEQSGLIDGASRHLWEHEFYVPFYRLISDTDGGIRGMNIKQGVIRQQAFKKLKGGKEGLNDLLANTLMNWAHLIDASAKNRGAKETLEAAARLGAAQPAQAGDKNTVWYMDGGKKAEYTVDDPELLIALNALDYSGLRGPIMDALQKPKHWLTIGVTASPFFKIRNLIRDSVQAVATSELSYNVAGNIMNGVALTSRDRQEYVSALAGGGLIRFGTMLEGNEAARTRQLIKKGAKDEHILDNEGKIRAFYDKYLEPGIAAYNEIGNRGEEINRMSLYDQLIKNGTDHATASLMARDMMDFSMQGTWTSIRFLAQVVPFFNARLQGMYKLGRAAKGDPAKFGAVLGAVSLFSLALLAAYSDDDDWKKREDWDRDNYWWFKVGGVAFRIPKPFEIGAIATLAERSAELMFDKEMTGKRFRQVTTKLLADQLSMNPTPQLVKPILDIYANKDSFSGRPIETMGMERLDKERRFTSSTSMPARGLSTATGGALSPVQIDHLVRGYFAWLGAFAVGAADLAVRAASDGPSRPSRDYWKFATGGMIAETDSASSRYVSQMYDQAKEIETAYGTWRDMNKQASQMQGAAKQDALKDAQEYRKENADKIARHSQVGAAKRHISALNERIRAIERSDRPSSEKRVLINNINKLKDQAARRAVATRRD